MAFKDLNGNLDYSGDENNFNSEWDSSEDAAVDDDLKVLYDESITGFIQVLSNGNPVKKENIATPENSSLDYSAESRNTQSLFISVSQEPTVQNFFSSTASSIAWEETNNANGGPHHRHRKRGALHSPVVIHDSRLGPGMGGSAVETLDSSGLQRFATEPAPQTAVLGSTVVLPCRVVNKVGHLQWTKDGFGLGNERRLYGFARYSMIGSDDEGDFSLRIQPVQLDDDGLFQCQVSASDGVPGIRSEEVQLKVYVPPDPPVVEPAELQTTTGLHATLKCTSRGGKPPPEIQWVDDKHPRDPLGLGAVTTMEMMGDSKRSIVTSTLTFVPRRTHDNSTITCITSHQALSTPLFSSARVRVYFAPEVQVSAHPPRLVEGDDAHFVCHAEANPPDLSFRWYHNSVELENQTLRTLTLPRISRDMHKDTVSCEVSNKVGSSKKTLGVHVRYGPVFRSLPLDAAAETGQEVLLRCSVDANPQPSIVWLQEGDNKIIGNGSELRVSVSPLTAGAYRCVAGVRERDLQFPELIGKMKVLLKGPPTIVSPTDQVGRPGATVHLECNTVSVPSPIKVTWTYRGKPVDLGSSRYEVKEEQRLEGLRTILVIHDAAETDFGDYNCSVVNEYGVARKLIRLNEEKRVPLALVLGSSGAFFLVVLPVAICVLCRKRVCRDKDSPEPEKMVSTPSGPPNMYSANADARLSDRATPSPTHASRGHENNSMAATGLGDNNLCGNNNFLEVNRSQKNNSYGHDGTSTFSPQIRREHRDDHSVYMPLMSLNDDHDIERRCSLSGLGSARAAPPADPRTPDFCTMRRGARGPDITLSHHMDRSAGHTLENNGAISHHLENNGSGSMMALPQPVNGIRHNGDIFHAPCDAYGVAHDGMRQSLDMNHHMNSRYSPYSPYGPSPPPHLRSPLHNGYSAANPSTSPRLDHNVNRRAEADYIYSSGAILKPGTLV
ncbi:irregular chiasm C-roughest protein [Hyalella azteca]|uniref:Irregular chiasm C-roughest protein n=1 Tax=Hyalella azteca TaxID=294128 RepID=A0A979FJQ9_HYAAZ|nr:irregular chiasm C-roughest protein [Hyalella azteca]